MFELIHEQDLTFTLIYRELYIDVKDTPPADASEAL
jgi:hypothetical protein